MCLIESHIFDEIVHENDIFRDKQYENPQKLQRLLKKYANRRSVGTVLENKYPFTEENLAVTPSVVGLGYSARPAST